MNLIDACNEKIGNLFSKIADFGAPKQLKYEPIFFVDIFP